MIQTVLVILGVLVFAILASVFYKKLKIEKLTYTIQALDLFVLLVLLYRLFSEIFYLLPFIIILLPFSVHKKATKFFITNALTNFAGVMSLLYVLVEITKDFNHISTGLVVILFFNTLLSLFAYVVNSYQIFDKPLKSSSRTSFELKPPKYYTNILGGIILVFLAFFIFGLFNFLMPLIFISLFLGLIFTLLISVMNTIRVNTSELVIENTFYTKKKKVFKIREIKKIVSKTIPGGYGMRTNLIEVHLKNEIKRIDVRTNYNDWDTLEFLKVLKRVFGDKFEEVK